jgi:orotate phosphoribosyltransferase
MSTVDLEKLLEQSGAVLRGHFVLTSGRHSDVYFEKFRLLEQPAVLSELCSRIVSHFRDSFDVVAGPTTGGVIMAFEVARQAGVRSLYVETEDGAKKVRRGGKVAPGARVLVVDDVLTTGLSVKETAAAVQAVGGKTVGFGVLIDRSESAVDLPARLFAAYRMKARSYPPDAVPGWLAEIPVTKPGTRAQ